MSVAKALDQQLAAARARIQARLSPADRQLVASRTAPAVDLSQRNRRDPSPAPAACSLSSEQQEVFQLCVDKFRMEPAQARAAVLTQKRPSARAR